MKINLKVVIALVIMAGTLVWAASSAQASAYSGTDLTFIVGPGAVTMTNPQDAPIPVQLTSRGSRAFTVVSNNEGISGASTTQGTGSSATQLFEFASPIGESQFTITASRGTNVNFITTATEKLNVSVQTLSANDARTTLIVAAVVVLGGLFYISRTTGHRWLARLRGQTAAVQTVKTDAITATAGQGAEIRAYGDNRSDKTQA